MDGGPAGNFLAISHARDVACDIRSPAAATGRCLALRGEVWTDVGAYSADGRRHQPARNVGQFITGPYQIENVSIDVAVQLPTNRLGTYRGPGRYEADFFARLFDLAAKGSRHRSAEFRRRNLVPEDKMPYPLPTVAPVPNPTALDSGACALVLDRCLAEAGWKDKIKLQGQLIDGRYHGVAVVCFIEGGAAGPKEEARIVLEADGSLTVYVGSSAVGQGVETVLGQIAADAMDVPFESIRVRHGSTTYVKEGWGSYHSRSTVMGGSAILAAAEELKARLKDALRASIARPPK